MLGKPNLEVPLAFSYNTRGNNPNGFITSNVDQRKVNCYYENIKNPASGKQTIMVAKRPGVAPYPGDALNGSTDQFQYSICLTPDNLNHSLVGIKDSSNNIKIVRATDTTQSVSSTIATSASEYPMFLTMGLLGASTNYAILQVGSSTTRTDTDNVYYSTDGTTWTNITDTDFVLSPIYVAGKMEIMDGYLFALMSDSKIRHSDLNSASSWSALNVIAKTITQDIPIGLALFRNQILAFGSESVEVFYNVPNNVGSTLGRLPHLTSKVGMKNLVHGNYYCTIQDKLFFIGSEAGYASSRSTALFAYDGQRFERIEHPVLTKLFAANPIYGIYSVPFNGRIAVGIQLTSSESTTGHRALLFFPEDNEWFEWTSDVFQIKNDGFRFLGAHTTATPSYNKLFYFPERSVASGGYRDEYTTSSFVDYPYTLQFTLPQDDGRPHRIPYCGVVGDTTRTAASLTIKKSTNDFQTFTTVGTIDMTKPRKAKYGMGMYQSAMGIQLTYTGAEDIRLSKFYASVTD